MTITLTDCRPVAARYKLPTIKVDTEHKQAGFWLNDSRYTALKGTKAERRAIRRLANMVIEPAPSLSAPRTVAAGQTWKPMDKADNRELRIMGIFGDGRVEVKNTATGKVSFINVSRFDGKSKNFGFVR